MLAYLLTNPVPPFIATAIVASGLTYGSLSAAHHWQTHWQQRQTIRRTQAHWPLAGCGRVSDDGWRAGVRLLLKESGMRVEYTTDRWGARHYRLVASQPQDTQPTLDTLASLTIARPAAGCALAYRDTPDSTGK